jgi:hypothetical protein
MHREFMGSPEDSDSDFLANYHHEEYVMNGEIIRCTPRLATRIFVRGPLCPAAFLLIVWME